ncbi:hypothetical protein BH686_16730 [Rhodococcus erythropolis]|nr:hypothetical protein BH686_16730 [Rhodococcus erythropolis]
MSAPARHASPDPEAPNHFASLAGTLAIEDGQEWSEQFRQIYGERLREVRRSKHTRRAYASDTQHFNHWCERRQLISMPAAESTLIGYLLYWGDPSSTRQDPDQILKATTLNRRIAGIKAAHSAANAPWPTSSHHGDDLVQATLDCIAVLQKSGRTSARALTIRKLHAVVGGLPLTSHGIRNQALLLTGFFGAFRRSELVNLDLADLTFSDGDGPDLDEGMILQIRFSKTDQKAAGRDVYINFGSNPFVCPVRSMRRWIELRGDEPGPLFTNIWSNGVGNSRRLSPNSVTSVLKAALSAIGDDPSSYSAHSLRSGFATAAAKAGVPARLIKQQTGHRSYEMVDRYVQDGSSLIDNATRYMQ